MTALRVERSGFGPPLVLVHGWGLHGGIFAGLAGPLRWRFRVHVPDLPGHGRSPRPPGGFGFASAVDALAAVLPRRASVLGWSLGGTLALGLALAHPDRVERLVLAAATPRFLSGPGWPGVEPEILTRFGRDLADDYRNTVKRFLALQVSGDEHATELLRQLRSQVFAHGDPDPAALGEALAVLADTDLRDALARVGIPTLVIAGERDRLAPAEAGRRMAAAMPEGRYQAISRAAHAPFLSHRESFTTLLEDFLHEPVAAP